MLDTEILNRYKSLSSDELFREVIESEKAARSMAEEKEKAEARFRHASQALKDRIYDAKALDEVFIFGWHAISSNGDRLTIRKIASFTD